MSSCKKRNYLKVNKIIVLLTYYCNIMQNKCLLKTFNRNKYILKQSSYIQSILIILNINFFYKGMLN